MTVPQELDPYVHQLFVAAGCRHVRLPVSPVTTKSSTEFASKVISDFGGLKVGTTGQGRELSASDVHFYSKPRLSAEEVVAPWRAKLGRLSAIASAHDDHMIIFVGADGSFYAFTDPDDRLYRIGATFSEAMNRLLLGLSYGEPMQKTSD